MFDDLLKHISSQIRISLEDEFAGLRADSAALAEQNAQLMKRLSDLELHNAGMHALLANMVMSNNALLKELDRFVRSAGGSACARKDAHETKLGHTGDDADQSMRQH